MNLNEYIKQTEDEFDKEFSFGVFTGKDYKAFIKTRIERGVELAYKTDKLPLQLVKDGWAAEAHEGFNWAVQDQQEKQKGFLG